MDSWDVYRGFDKEKALEAFEKEKTRYDSSNAYDRKRNMIEFKEYNLPDEITADSDEDDIIEAVCNCIGYDGEKYYNPDGTSTQ